MAESLFELTRETGNLLPERKITSIYLSLASEVGELAQEVDVEIGGTYKEKGEDGIVGEAVDAIITLFDLIQTHDPTFTEEDLLNYGMKKLQKWKTKTLERVNK